MGSKVAEFYDGKNIFITGATGFLGSCLIEKLLRTTAIKNIYVLMRPKKGKQINERLEELTKNSVIIQKKILNLFLKKDFVMTFGVMFL